MKIWRGLGTRIVIVAVLCGLLGLVISWATIRRTSREAMQAGFGAYVHRTMEGPELLRCEGDPDRWTLELDRGGQLFAYDATSLLSKNPNAPPIDPALYERLESGEPSPVNFSRFGGGEHGATMLLKTSAGGTCGIIQATFAPQPSRRRHFYYFMLIGALIVIAAAAALGVFVVVQPLTRRIGRLRTSAGVVGSPDGYLSASDPARDELGELSVSLDRAHARIRADADSLVERQRALERYLADIAHDLKTPIASLQMALEQAAKLSSGGEMTELLKSSVKDVIYLDALTTNLRIACQLRDGWSPADGDPRVDLAEVLDRVISRTRYFAKNRGISLESSRPDASVFAGCHPTAAEQAITNLVENAIAYGDPGGHVAVVLESDDRAFLLVVKDDGPGVLPAELPRLGERTFRSDEARQRDPSGSGLGLAITSEICDLCSWKLTFEPESPRGLHVGIAGPTIGPPAEA